MSDTFDPALATKLSERYETTHGWCSAAMVQLRAAVAEVETMQVDRKQLGEVLAKTNDALNRAGCYSALYYWEHIDKIAADRDRLAERVKELEALAASIADDLDIALAAHDPGHPNHRSKGGQHHNGPCCSFGNVTPGAVREFRRMRDMIRAELAGKEK